jgi:hypothetical protein
MGQEISCKDTRIGGKKEEEGNARLIRPITEPARRFKTCGKSSNYVSSSLT